MQEFGVPAVLPQLVQEGTPLGHGLAVVYRLLAAAGFGLPDRAQRKLVDMAHVDPGHELLAAQFQQTGSEIHSQVLVVRGQEDRLVTTGGQLWYEMTYSVEGDDRLSGAGTAPDSGRSRLATLHKLGLRGVEEDLPTAEVAAFQRSSEGFVRSGQPGRGIARRRLVDRQWGNRAGGGESTSPRSSSAASSPP